MSDDDRKDKNDTEFDDHTAIRQQPNADKTAVKGGAADPDAADSSNKTIVRGKNPTRRDRGKAPSDAAPVDNSGDATIIRGEDERPAASNEDATIIRDEKPAPAGDDDATISKGDKGRRTSHQTIHSVSSHASESKTSHGLCCLTIYSKLL